MAAGSVVFLFDAHMSPRLSQALIVLGERVVHLDDILPRGVVDEVWLRHAGANDYFVVTYDRSIRKRPHEYAAFMAAGIGGFFIEGSIRGHCKIVSAVIKHWPEMKRLAAITPRPFSFRVSARSVRPLR